MNKRTDIKTDTKAGIKAAVTAAFSAAAVTYDDRAAAQRDIAASLARRIEALRLPQHPRVLEIGCGTGFLSRYLTRLNARELILTDISPVMVECCRASVNGNNLRLMVMDGEDAHAAGDGFDLICSSLAFQWFTDLRASCRDLASRLAPGGYLAFSTLAADTFHEWRDAHRTLGLEPALRSYPSPQVLAQMLPPDGVLDMREEHHRRRYIDGHAFIAELKHIGAHLPEDSSRALSPGALRRVLRSVEGGIDATYHVASVIWRKP